MRIICFLPTVDKDDFYEAGDNFYYTESSLFAAVLGILNASLFCSNFTLSLVNDIVSIPNTYFAHILYVPSWVYHLYARQGRS